MGPQKSQFTVLVEGRRVKAAGTQAASARAMIETGRAKVRGTTFCLVSRGADLRHSTMVARQVRSNAMSPELLH